MKQFSLAFLLAAFALTFTGCIEIFENFYLNKDGSGRYEVSMDMSALMSQEFKDMMASFSEEAEEEDKEPVEVDTAINFASIDPDKVRKLSRPEVFENATLHIEMSDSKERMVMTTTVNFKTIEDIDYFNKHSADIMENMGDGGGLGISSGGMLPQATKLFSLKGRKLTRANADPGGGNLMDGGGDMEMVRMMMSDAIYTTTYHLPGQVKKTSIPGARVEGSQVIVENDFLELLEGNVRQDGTIQFKRK
jgi:hypothetical protein